MSLPAKPLPSDAAARVRALDPEHSFICVAPAGSGKTELLTQRVLVLLARVQKPEEILAITFTRKAAAEMQHRVLGALKMATGPKPQEPHKQQTWQLASAALKADAHYGWQLLANPHRLHIRTFDGLCASLVKALPLQAQMGVGVVLSDDPERLFTLAAKQLLAELESAGPIADALAQLLLHLDNQHNRLRELLVELLKSRAAWLPLVLGQQGDVRAALEACLVNLQQAHVARLQHLIPAVLAPNLCALASFAARNLPEGSTSPIAACSTLTALPGANLHGLLVWQGLATFLLTSAGQWRQRYTKNEGLPPKAEGVSAAELKNIKADIAALVDALSHSEQLREALAQVTALPYSQYPDPQWQILQALTTLLPRLVAYLQLTFASEGELDFTEMSLRADRALGLEGEPTDLALRLDHRISHVLVDEFQDTSSSQMQLVQKLTAGWQVGDGRTLFCVGDAMQSIYAFRSANVGLFLRCLGGQQGQGHLGGIPLEPLRLNTNFRSSAGVVEWINHVFLQAFPAEIDLNTGAVPFNPAEAFNPHAGPAVVVQGFSGEGAKAAEGEWVAGQIAQLLAQNPKATVAILGRGRKPLGDVLPALKAANIPYRAVDLDPLAAVPAVQDAWVLTRALLSTSDTIAWLSVLRAPWCGARLAGLLSLRTQPGSSVFGQMGALLAAAESGTVALEGDDIVRLANTYRVLALCLAERERKPLRDTVKGAWLALGGAAALTPSEQHNVERFFDALAACSEPQLQQQPERLNKLLSELYALPDPDAGSQIQVMTMHKSKGLEFDAVFLVGLAAGTGRTDTPLMRWHEQLFDDTATPQKATTWLLSPMGERGQDKDPLYQWLGLQQKKREHLEACRLLYVACTRAKQALFLSATLKQKEAALEAPSAGSLLAHIWPAVASNFSLHCQNTDQNSALNPEDTSHKPTFKRLAEPWLGLNSFTTERLSTLESTQKRPPSGAEAHSPEAVAIGLLVHEVLELFAPQLHAAHWQAPNWANFEAIWQARLVAFGMPVAVSAAGVTRVQSLLTMALAKDSPLRAALDQASAINPEYTLVTSTPEGCVELRIDMWWRTALGQVYLLDYKTSQPKEGQTLEAFAAEQRALHQPTLQHYAQALAQEQGQPVTPVLYLLATGQWLLGH